MERFIYYSHADHGQEAERPPQEQDTAQNRYMLYPQLTRLISPKDQAQPAIPELREVFAVIGKESDGEKQLDILDEVLAQHKMNDVYHHVLASWGMYQKELSAFIKTNEHYPRFTEALLPHQDQFRFPLAVLLSHYTTATLPMPWQKQLQSQFVSKDMRASVTEKIPQWHLCSSSEQYVIRAMDDSAVTDVNGVMLVKHVGRLAGLCVINATTPEGTFIRGNWYAPVEQQMREVIRNAHDCGIGHLSISGGTWTLIRTVTDYAGIEVSDIVNQAEDCLTSLPNHLTDRINEYTRADYRRHNQESY
jgi:hypothetical protein